MPPKNNNNKTKPKSNVTGQVDTSKNKKKEEKEARQTSTSHHAAASKQRSGSVSPTPPMIIQSPPTPSKDEQATLPPPTPEENDNATFPNRLAPDILAASNSGSMLASTPPATNTPNTPQHFSDSSTPRGQPHLDSKRDAKNTVSFRIGHAAPASPEKSTATAPQQPTSYSTREKMTFKLKRALHESLEYCFATGDIGMLDDTIFALDNALRELQHFRIDLKFAQRHSIGRSHHHHQDPNTASSPQPAGHSTPTSRKGNQSAEDPPRPKMDPAPTEPNETTASTTSGAKRASTASAGSGKAVPKSPAKPCPARSPSPEPLSSGVAARLLFPLGKTRPTLEDKQRQAEERRQNAALERLQRHQVSEERQMQAKSRKEQTIERIRTQTEEKQERAAQLHETAITTVTDKARESNTRTDEVVLIQKMKEENRRIELEAQAEVIHERAERKKEVHQENVKKNEITYNAVHERRREIEERRKCVMERKQKEKEGRVSAFEERKQVEQESRHAKNEERQQKIAEAQLHILEEEEQRLARVTQRVESAEATKQAIRDAQREKLELQKRKAQEARERKDSQKDSSPSHGAAARFVEALQERTTSPHQVGGRTSTPPSATISKPKRKISPIAVEDIPAPQPIPKVDKAVRKAHTWVENSVKQFLHNYTPDGVKSPVRPLVLKLQSIVSSNKPVMHLRSCLHDIANRPTGPFSPQDHAVFRDTNIFATLVEIMESHSRTSEGDVPFRLASTVLQLILQEDAATPNSTIFFVRAGCLIPCCRLIVSLLRDSPVVDFEHIGPLFSAVQCGVSVAMSAMIPGDARSRITTLLEDSGITKLCTALTTFTPIPLTPASADAVYNALCITASTVQQSGSDETLTSITRECLTLISNVLLHSSLEEFTSMMVCDPSSASGASTASRITSVCFVALRVVNHVCSVARSRAAIRAVMMESLHEVTHVLHMYLTFIGEHPEVLEDATTMMRHTPRSDEMRSYKCHRALLHEMLMFIGNMCVNDEKAQHVFLWGKTPLLRLLCNLPVVYFTEPLCHMLFPVLIVMCFRNGACLEVLGSEVSLTRLAKYVADSGSLSSTSVSAAAAAASGGGLSSAITLFKHLPDGWRSEAATFFTAQTVPASATS
eukprot:PhM_4_TR309/c0_g1_i1/m.13748